MGAPSFAGPFETFSHSPFSQSPASFFFFPPHLSSYPPPSQFKLGALFPTGSSKAVLNQFSSGSGGVAAATGGGPRSALLPVPTCV
ncbi:hypothetical protein CEXT_36911 [Caerostris extrusa]|uniref:Uncharacterized protein n=1 Tax=Caerostris extrusa TaxID=172846 RepID=A0AAV4VVQ8_CAEEX|nr:hypothetical protein CEXT_36911 [Caerostris extrusa]